MADDYLRTHVIDGSHWCTQDRGKTDIDSQPRIIALRAANSRLVSENDELKRHIQSAREQTGTRVADWISRSDFEELEKHAGELERDRQRFEGLYIATRSEQVELELHCQDLERSLLDVTAERDRLRKGFADSVAKHKVYRREIARLQRALLVERGQRHDDHLDWHEQQLADCKVRLTGLEARLNSMESPGRNDPPPPVMETRVSMTTETPNPPHPLSSACKQRGCHWYRTGIVKQRTWEQHHMDGCTLADSVPSVVQPVSMNNPVVPIPNLPILPIPEDCRPHGCHWVKRAAPYSWGLNHLGKCPLAKATPKPPYGR